MECNGGRGETAEIDRDRGGEQKNRRSEMASESIDMHSGKGHSREIGNALLDSGGSQTSFAGENDGGVAKRISDLELSEENVYSKRKGMCSRNQADRPDEDCGSGVCVLETKEKSEHAGASFTSRDRCRGRGCVKARDSRKVRFDPELKIYEVPNEDRMSEWMTAAVDRSRFERRIEEMSHLLDPILKRRLQLYEWFWGVPEYGYLLSCVLTRRIKLP